jgi:hypothetical protein
MRVRGGGKRGRHIQTCSSGEEVTKFDKTEYQITISLYRALSPSLNTPRGRRGPNNKRGLLKINKSCLH